MGQLIAKILFDRRVMGKVVPPSSIGNIGQKIVQFIIKC